ncbi:DUF4494 domain-containing protein [Eisenibacter elegans]|jgi:hypothetical protein|uniref:DUF4494 domain-containing protein n=1 Tax=Eisenibacter elegans TaxID=997 RepID=UPI000416C38A|nr:DUF4494 domain-containing protein [Eisenibacter elegans]
MKTWFACTVKYDKEEGEKVQKVTENYLVDAISFSEAETRMYEELGSVIRSEFKVHSISQTKFADIFPFDDSDQWYQCKISYVSIDEKSGKEKKISQVMLITATDVKQAYERLEERLSTMIVPYTVHSISESKILEIFEYVSSEERRVRLLSKESAEA